MGILAHRITNKTFAMFSLSILLATSLLVFIASPVRSTFGGVVRRAKQEQQTTSSSSLIVLCVPRHQAVAWYRAKNAKIIDHFYTTQPFEIRNAEKKLGYKDEGIAGLVFQSVQPGTVPFYRLYSPKHTNHFYTINVQERDNAIQKLGYRFEGITGYIYSKRLCGTFPLYRLYNAKGADHFYTTSEKERDTAALQGWKKQGIAGYIFEKFGSPDEWEDLGLK